MSVRTSVKVALVDDTRLFESCAEKYNSIESRYNDSKKTDLDKLRRMMEVRDLISIIFQARGAKKNNNIAQKIFYLSAINGTWTCDSNTVLGAHAMSIQKLIIKKL
jgi:hypothetical protein